MAWVKLTDFWFVCEYGCFNHDPDYSKKEEHCNHSSDASDDDGKMNAAHWKRTAGDKSLPHGFLCNYHYEELVLGIKHPQDGEVESEAAGFEWPSAAEFELFIGEVK